MEHMDAKAIFHMGKSTASLGLIVTEGARELGAKVDNYLVQMAAGSPEAKDTFIIDSECPRFQSGDGKGLIKDT
ncbi:MAG: ribose-phosphate pyrophosphokinase, partial [Hydrogeniiclostridium sp.]